MKRVGDQYVKQVGDRYVKQVYVHAHWVSLRMCMRAFAHILVPWVLVQAVVPSSGELLALKNRALAGPCAGMHVELGMGPDRIQSTALGRPQCSIGRESTSLGSRVQH